MKPYSIQERHTCPKCGFRWGQPVSIRYEPGPHDDCRMEYEHLHGYCGYCGYDGIEYVYTVKKKE